MRNTLLDFAPRLLQLLATKEMTSRQTVSLPESGHDGERRAHSSPEELRGTNDYATFYYGCSSSPTSCQCRPQGKVGLQLVRSRPAVVSRSDEHDEVGHALQGRGGAQLPLGQSC